jgi:FtsH-binding integral membrane protein
MQADIQANNPYATFGRTVAQAQPNERVAFIRKTYIHLAAAIYAFVALSWFALSALPLDQWLAGAANIPMFGLIMLGAFIFTSFIANKWANSDTSIGLQYAGLGLYVVAEAFIFAPLLFFAQKMTIDLGWGLGDTSVIAAAALITVAIFGALTAAVFLTGKDFSFLRTALVVGTIAAFAIFLAGFFIGFQIGFWFLAAMVVMACGWVLYDTSNVLHHYRTDQHVAASLALFASIALLFWYILQIVMSLSNRD